LPPTVQGILAARIDRLPGEHKQLLQMMAVIGRESRLDVIGQIIPAAEAQFHRMLTELQASEFIYEQPASPQARYIFKHALTHEVAYNSMLVEQRKALHERAGQALETMFSDQLEDHVAELARHYSSSDNISKGVEYLGRAGQQASKRAAYVEAVSNLSLGLDLLMKMPETPERDKQELALQSALGPSLMETKGDSAPETNASYSRAADLSQRVGENDRAFWALGGLFLHHMVGGRSRIALGIAKQMLDLAQAADDADKLMTAHGFMGIILFWMGELALAHSHFEQFALRIDPPRQRHLAEFYGMDVAAGCLGYAACPLWMMGYARQALQRFRRGLSLAQERGHLSSSVMGLYWAAFGHVLRRESEIAQELLAAALELANEHGFALWKALSTFLLGQALVQSGREAKGIVCLEEGIVAAEALGSQVGGEQGELAYAYGKTGQTVEGLRLIAKSLAALQETERAAFEPELHRVKGELLLMHDAANAGEAESCFRTAIEHAREHEAKSWELRATTSLARLLAHQGKRDEARAMLAEIYNWFTEGFDTADLKETKALIDELSR
jgi:tetratricopeptide (TPR) repeat protein